MTRNLLNQVAKAKKVNLDHFDSVISFINDNYTKVFVILAIAEICGGTKRYCCRKELALSVSAICKKGEVLPEDYETSSWEYISDIR